MKALYLIDAHGIFYRSMYAPMPALMSPSGVPTKGVFGFVNTIQDIWKTCLHPISHCAVCFDPKPSTLLKREIDPSYKGNRPSKGADVALQLKICRDIVQAMELTVVRCHGYEADDCIASIVKTMWVDFDVIFIITSDKDLMQLVDDEKKICIYEPFDRRYIKEADVVAKWGVKPSQLLDLQTLTGDSTDNVRGCEGIGPKTAAKFISQWGTLEKALNYLDTLPPKKAKAIRDCDLSKTRKLVKLLRDAPVPASELDYRAPQRLLNSTVREMYETLGFRKALAKS